MDDKEFEKLLFSCQEIASGFPQGLIFIGGIAVYLHVVNLEELRALAEFTHDADFYISLADMADLRDLEEVTANRRLNKHQLIKGGFEFDIYTERHSALIVPYEQVEANSVCYDRLRVANLSHLLILKLEAYRDRQKSSKGQKDAKDLIRIVLAAQALPDLFSIEDSVAYLSEEHIELLESICRGPEFLSLTKGNSKEAKDLRKKFQKTSFAMRDAYG